MDSNKRFVPPPPPKELKQPETQEVDLQNEEQMDFVIGGEGAKETQMPMQEFDINKSSDDKSDENLHTQENDEPKKEKKTKKLSSKVWYYAGFAVFAALAVGVSVLLFMGIL